MKLELLPKKKKKGIKSKIEYGDKYILYVQMLFVEYFVISIKKKKIEDCLQTQSPSMKYQFMKKWIKVFSQFTNWIEKLATLLYNEQINNSLE